MRFYWQMIVFILVHLLSNALVQAEKGIQQLAASQTVRSTVKEIVQLPTYFQRARSYATHPESDPPRYVRNLSKTGIDAFKDIIWLDVGLDYRMRYEYRNNDLRRPALTTDNPFLLRTRMYLGIKEILDPFRLVAEFEDARRYNGKFSLDNRDANEFELIQTFGELYFKDALGHDDLGNHHPLRIRAGRMAWEVLDRRLLGNNQWRNTTNSFEGFRLNLGQENNDWEIDLWGVQPVTRLIKQFDERNKDQWFYGGIINWRKWSNIITLQPYYMGLIQDGNADQIERKVHSPAMRGYGKLPNTEVDFDFGIIYQFGHEGLQKKSAWAYLAEIGYTLKHEWKPRISVFYGYASGDRNPDDNVNNRFERFFGFARPWSADDYMIFENIQAPKVKLEFEPFKDLSIDGGYGWFWLASDSDRFNNLLGGASANRDKSGSSGNFLGHAFDIRARYKLHRVETSLGYSHFSNGEFVRTRQQAALGQNTDSTHFFYFEIVINAFN
ncbi:Alginate export [Nitrosomonas cryotolerans]|uniref:Alginate export n=2 Tax=Nitrosomonas cryotolerans TaxID=44575 RepID=A0A1N6HT77_9PROT|nr:Alginate export [Nitrosomonas cryotolerans]SIO22997.1 Alginate export [Nitrosomonas cryotolerans ATCC 49181]